MSDTDSAINEQVLRGYALSTAHARGSWMKSSRSAVVLCQALVVLMPLLMARAAADPTPPSFTVSPDHGPAGSGVQLWGTQCISNGSAAQSARAFLYRDADPGDVPRARADKTYIVLPDGSRSGDFQIPDDAPVGAYHFSVDCYRGDAVMNAGTQPFIVDGATASPSTSSSPRPVVATTPQSDASRTPSPSPSRPTAAPPTSTATAVAGNPRPVPTTTTLIRTGVPSTPAPNRTPHAATRIDEQGRTGLGSDHLPVLLAALLLALNAGLHLLIRKV